MRSESHLLVAIRNIYEEKNNNRIIMRTNIEVFSILKFWCCSFCCIQMTLCMLECCWHLHKFVVVVVVIGILFVCVCSYTTFHLIRPVPSLLNCLKLNEIDHETVMRCHQSRFPFAISLINNIISLNGGVLKTETFFMAFAKRYWSPAL